MRLDLIIALLTGNVSHYRVNLKKFRRWVLSDEILNTDKGVETMAIPAQFKQSD